MALFGRDYDRDYGYRGGTWNRGGYDRGYGGGWNAGGRDDSYGSWNRNFTGMTRDNRGYGMSGGYDRDFGMSGGYDRGYKSRWQTDFGDPFGDRAAHTPMRMIRGEFRGGYDRSYRGGNRDVGYGRDYYEANPMSYDPYTPNNRDYREGTWMRGNDRNYRGGYGRGYDSGWF